MLTAQIFDLKNGRNTLQEINALKLLPPRCVAKCAVNQITVGLMHVFFSSCCLCAGNLRAGIECFRLVRVGKISAFMSELYARIRQMRASEFRAESIHVDQVLSFWAKAFNGLGFCHLTPWRNVLINATSALILISL